MPSDLWSFTLDFYARAGVEQACLALQADGANVCMVLCGVWLRVRGVPCTAQRLDEIGQLATPWHDDVVRPLRELRTQWKSAAQHDVALGTLRNQVKALELDAERQLLVRLQTMTESWSETGEVAQGEWLGGLAGAAGENNHDALQVLRVAADLTTDA
ncbi:TIGR02444 family protein [Pseudomonas sp. R1-18]|uniref:TIGR02444 family protein n=1 Tax=Pseudomonas sp. R1-18 TaxID=1632772 RepID=UPI003DA98972